MTYTENGGVGLYYETDGSGEPVAFVGDVGYGAWQWGWQHAAVAGPYRSIVADLRGCGRSDAPSGPYDVPTLVDDLTAVLSDAGVRSAHVVGAGLGGMVALEAARTTARVDSLVLLGTAASGGGLDLAPLRGGLDDPDALERSLRAGLSAEFVESHPDAVAQMVEWRAAEDAKRAAWEAQAAAVADFDVSDRLYEITAPALVVHGTDDAVWPLERGEALASGLPRGEFSAVDAAGHLVHVEASRRVNDDVLGFLSTLDDE
ncbi:alpha/beta fold hydrolase [Halobellus rufus]|uniref:alpha/beta fold hydrolase n=1 Tax=Halobellus rufus TaxID=1448860 RepID=UPI00067903BD|nr:alpha/beta hydrolase [Halobellus rufus]